MSLTEQSQAFTKLLNIERPIIGGAMYPCSNPELVAAVSEAGGIGIVQPISLTFVHGYDFRNGIRHIKTKTTKPIGLNLLIEKSSKKYLEKNQNWLDIAIEEGVRFFITALGNPNWVVKRLETVPDASVFHDVTNRKWAQKAVDAGVHGLICVNNQAGGHAGTEPPHALRESLLDFNMPLVCAGGIGGKHAYHRALEMGYAGVQMGTRFIATQECSAHNDYKNAILNANAEDIVLTEKITGVPVSVIKTDYIKQKGVEPSSLVKALLSSNKTKHLMRFAFSIKSIWQLKKSLKNGSDYREFYQAGKSVAEIHDITTVKEVIDEMVGK